VSPEEAETFYEDDEDPQKIFARFDSGTREVTRWQTEPTAQIRWARDYIRSRYGSRDVSRRYAQGGLLP
jgi:hypothetical protein